MAVEVDGNGWIAGSGTNSWEGVGGNLESGDCHMLCSTCTTAVAEAAVGVAAGEAEELGASVGESARVEQMESRVRAVASW